jgi:hypothetical protein
MAKARPRRSPRAPSDGALGGTANGGGKAEASNAPDEASLAPEVLDLDENVVYQRQDNHDQGQEDEIAQRGYGQPGAAGGPSQWPSSGAAGWDGDGTGAWDAATEWGAEDQGEAWEEQTGWDGGLEATTWEADGGADDGEIWVEPDWSASGYERGYTEAYPRSRDEALAAYQDYGTLERDTGWTEEVPRGPKRQQTRGNGPWPELVMITAVAVIVAAVILAVTSADRSTGSGPQTAATLPAITAQRTHSSVPATGKSSKSTSPPATSKVTQHPSTPTTLKAAKPKAATQAKNLAVTAGVGQSLIKSWLATNPGGVDLVPKDVAGTVPRQLYYAVQPASATYWATVVFKPSAALLAASSTAAGQTKLAQFQNSVYVFSWKAGPVWTLLGEVSSGSCPNSWVPKSVLAVWGLCGV